MSRCRSVVLAGVLLMVTAVLGGPVLTAPAAHADGLEAPSGLAPSGGSVVDGSVTLSWERPSGVTAFDVQVATAADFATTLVSVKTVNVQYVPTGQLPAGELWWRVRSTSGSATSDWSTDSFEHASASAPVRIRPLDDVTIVPPVDAPRFAWKPVAGATAYTLQIGPDPEFTDPALVAASTQRTTAAVLTGYQAPGTYYWRVSATLSSGYSTPWSQPTRYQVEGLAPAQLTVPDDGFDAPVRDVVLDWEPVPGAVTYQLEVSTDDAFLTVVESAPVITGTRYSPPDGLANDEYYWRVRPVDASGNKAPWPSTPWRFRRAWPDQPTLRYPVGDLTGSTVPLFYQWDAMERASEYTLLVYDATGKQICSTTTVHTTVANVCRPGTAGDYRWKVLGTDSGGVGPVTDVIAQEAAQFHYEPPTSPSAGGPLTVEMVAGEAAAMSGTAAYGIGQERDVCTAAIPATCVDLRQTPVLTWDPVPGAVRYVLTLSRDRELTNPIATYKVTDPIWTPTTTLADSQAGSAYFWVVQPCWGAQSVDCAPLQHAERSFAKKSVAPHLVAPVEHDVDGTTVVPVVADDVTLDWGSELAALRDPAAAAGSSLITPASTEARSYQVQTALDPAFTSSIETATVDQTTFTSYTTTYPEGFVYWRVRALDGSGNPTVWSQTGTFEKRSPVPQLGEPADGAAIGADYALSWDPLGYAAGYDVEVYAGPTKVGGATGWKLTSWAPSDPFPSNADGYTWRVRRVDARGRKGAWSEVRTFRSPGFAPVVVRPAPDAVVPPSAGSFAWEPDDRATSYRFERRKAGLTTLAETVATRSSAWAPTAALPAGSWQWRVVALDAKGAALGASPWQDFAVVDPPAVVTPVTISGSGEVGTELLVSAPAFDPAVSEVGYQWLRGSSPIPDATGTTYTVVAADLGKALSVRATGVLGGYQPAVTTSTKVTAVTGLALVAVHAPSIVGPPAVGETLSVSPGDWLEEPKLTYQWYRADDAIPRATGPEYALTASDAGRQIHVLETATVPGREPGTAASDAVRVAKIRSTTTLTLGSPRVTRRQRVSVSVEVEVAGIGAPGGSVTFYDGSRKIALTRLGDGSTASVTLPRLAAGRHVIKAVYGGSTQALSSSGSARLRVT